MGISGQRASESAKLRGKQHKCLGRHLVQKPSDDNPQLHEHVVRTGVERREVAVDEVIVYAVEKCRSRVPEGQIWRSRHVRDQLFPGSTNARTSNHSDVVCEVKPQGETKLHPLGYDHDGSCIVGWGTSASARIHQNMACHPQQHITRKYALLQRGI